MQNVMIVVCLIFLGKEGLYVCTKIKLDYVELALTTYRIYEGNYSLFTSGVGEITVEDK